MIKYLKATWPELAASAVIVALCVVAIKVVWAMT